MFPSHDPTNTKVYQGDSTNQADGTNITAFVERTGLVPKDLHNRYQLRNIYPEIEGTNGGVVNVYVGSQNAIDETVTYSSAIPFTIGTDYRINCNVEGRLLAVKFESTTDIEWKLHGYQLDVELRGEV